MIGPVLLASDKGGVGKTALSAHLAAVAARQGQRVLVVDGDPRATATLWLGVTDAKVGLNEVLRVGAEAEVPADPADLLPQLVVPAGPEWPDLVRVLPATRGLANRNSDNTPGLTSRLARALVAAQDDYDAVIVDAPGVVGGTLMQALIMAARRVVVPTDLTIGGISGVAGMLRTLDLMRSAAPHAELVGVTLAMYEKRPTRDAAFHLEELRTKFGQVLLPEETWVLKRAVSRDAQTAQAPITAYPNARDITDPVTELLERIET